LTYQFSVFATEQPNKKHVY